MYVVSHCRLRPYPTQSNLDPTPTPPALDAAQWDKFFGKATPAFQSLLLDMFRVQDRPLARDMLLHEFLHAHDKWSQREWVKWVEDVSQAPTFGPPEILIMHRAKLAMRMHDLALKLMCSRAYDFSTATLKCQRFECLAQEAIGVPTPDQEEEMTRAVLAAQARRNKRERAAMEDIDKAWTRRSRRVSGNVATSMSVQAALGVVKVGRAHVPPLPCEVRHATHPARRVFCAEATGPGLERRFVICVSSAAAASASASASKELLGREQEPGAVQAPQLGRRRRRIRCPAQEARRWRR